MNTRNKELEITAINDMYLKGVSLHAQLFGRGFTWMDAGIIDSFRVATNFVCIDRAVPRDVDFGVGRDRVTMGIRKVVNQRN